VIVLSVLMKSFWSYWLIPLNRHFSVYSDRIIRTPHHFQCRVEGSEAPAVAGGRGACRGRERVGNFCWICFKFLPLWQCRDTAMCHEPRIICKVTKHGTEQCSLCTWLLSR